jgi:hypothetical protein
MEVQAIHLINCYHESHNHTAHNYESKTHLVKTLTITCMKLRFLLNILLKSSMPRDLEINKFLKLKQSKLQVRYYHFVSTKLHTHRIQKLRRQKNTFTTMRRKTSDQEHASKSGEQAYVCSLYTGSSRAC